MEILLILAFIIYSYTLTGNNEAKKTLVKLPVGKNTGNKFDENAFTEITLALRENRK